MTFSGRLAAIGVLLAVGAVVAYVLLLRVPVVRNHPEVHVAAFALATGLAAYGRRALTPCRSCRTSSRT
jgi:hypothetical protein